MNQNDAFFMTRAQSVPNLPILNSYSPDSIRSLQSLPSPKYMQHEQSSFSPPRFDLNITNQLSLPSPIRHGSCPVLSNHYTHLDSPNFQDLNDLKTTCMNDDPLNLMDMKLQLDSPSFSTQFQPLASTIIEMSNNKQFFVVGTERIVKYIDHPTQIREMVCCALHTILPCLGRLQFGEHITVDVLFYDFYYVHNKLHAIIIVLHSWEVYDAFTFAQDLLHNIVSLNSMLNIPTLSKTLLASWFKNINTFRPYWIINNQQMYEELDRGLISQVKQAHFKESSLRMWLTPNSNNLLSRAHRVDTDIPTTYHIIPPQLADKLSHLPVCATLNSNWICVNSKCQCHQLQNKCRYEVLTGKRIYWTILDTLEHMKSNIHNHIKEFLAPTIRSMVEAKLNPVSVISTETKIITPINIAGSTKLHKRPPVCVCKSGCKSRVSCLWIPCCYIDEPIACAKHVREQTHGNSKLYASGPTMSICPVHKVKGCAVSLI